MATVTKYSTQAGTRYEVRHRTPSNGSTRKRGFTTKRDAQAYAAQVEVAKQTGAFVQASSGRATVGSLGPAWVERQKAHVKPSGWRSYESAWRVHCEPRWGSVPLNRVKYTEVQAWVAELSVTKGPVVVQTAHSVLARILDDAVRDRLLAVNPARGVKLPRKVRKPNVYLTHDQVEALATEAGHYRSLVLLLSYTGLRWGEAAGLRVADVNFLKRRILVHENAVTVGSVVHVGTLKGHKHREVPLPVFVADELARTCVGKSRDELLWASRSGGHLGPPASKESWLSGAVERCRKADPTFPRITAHLLRHCAASFAVSAGANVKVVQRLLGHSSAGMTLDVYADLFDSDLDSVADALDASVSKTRPKQEPQATPSTGSVG
ncbi:tyrosine-type recombinase/integrase [Rhodococcus sp. JS3073]|uniref:tyrosine-type recombinase/integrase n=1 Tax=Rhodococcus sp. JS3073 TaxID=3002901 RepID=UPI002286BEA7|nr:tyrosine-type recombinase/integrase [Rhodococcus sp. JS3073]WAM17520.1 tyrosine-type recombinase/integrase [Rhodococcus sp. JS3073]